MKIGIIGAGNIGGTLTRLWAAAGYEILVSSRHPGELTALVKEAGDHASAGSVEDAAEFGEVVFLAMPLKGVVDTLPKIQSVLAGKVILDAMNPFPNRDGDIALDIQRRGIASGVATQERLPDSTVVRAFSSIRFRDLQTEHHRNGDRLAVPIAGDDPAAKDVATKLVRDAGFVAYDIGTLAESRPLDPGGVLFVQALTHDQVAKALNSA